MAPAAPVGFMTIIPARQAQRLQRFSSGCPPRSFGYVDLIHVIPFSPWQVRIRWVRPPQISVAVSVSLCQAPSSNPAASAFEILKHGFEYFDVLPQVRRSTIVIAWFPVRTLKRCSHRCPRWSGGSFELGCRRHDDEYRGRGVEGGAPVTSSGAVPGF